MKLTSKGRYAVTAILDLAFHSHTGPVSLSQVSRRQDLSLSYLEQLFTRLRKEKLVRSTRGPGGGYSLERPPEDITIAEVIAAVDEDMDTTRCSGEINCQDGKQCLSHELWDELSQQIYLFLKEISLRDLMEEPDILQVAERQDQKMGQSVSLKPDKTPDPVSS